MLGRMRLMAIAAMLGAATLPAHLGAPPPTIMRAPARSTRKLQRRQLGAVTSPAGYGRKGAGITMAAQQRASAKRRNVARNRRNHR